MTSTVKKLGVASAGVLISVAGSLWASPARAGNGANFVLYNDHMEEKGTTEIQVFSDFSNVGGDEKNYSAQLLEIEYGITDLWTTALYLEGVKASGEDYELGSFRFENRVRLFSQPTLLNPVLYIEYEQKQPESQFILSVVGRTDGEKVGEEATEHELETRLILGHDFSDRFNIAFNWINELNFDDGVWAYGYATGLNYVLFRTSGGEKDVAQRERKGFEPNSLDLKKLTLGIEVYGGLGDSVRGLTIDSGKTQQYAGVNLQAGLENHVHLGIGGAFGLTGDSDNAILRLTAGYEFE